VPDRGFDVAALHEVVMEGPREPFPLTRLREGTSWSCHHGILRWHAECPCVVDGRWKRPLRAALDRLAGGVDAVSKDLLRVAGTDPQVLWDARDRYVDVIAGRVDAERSAREALGADRSRKRRDLLVRLLDVQRWRLAMFASDGWYWDDPAREETRHGLRCAAKAVRAIDAVAGTRIERELLDDLSLLSSPTRRIDGAAIYREALGEVGQPLP
jgi:hypothetical protein